jgi:hypothetical protein
LDGGDFSDFLQQLFLSFSPLQSNSSMVPAAAAAAAAERAKGKE